MKMYVGVTDNDWYRFLAERQPDEVNFWQPSGHQGFRVLQPGGLFLFKLHSPLNYIAGGGFFVRHSLLPLSVAWSAFEEKNGAPDLEMFQNRIFTYQRQRDQVQPDPVIGCIMLVEPFFFDRAHWIPVPEDWSPNIVQGKGYDTSDPNGAKLWNQVEDRLLRSSAQTRADHEPATILREGPRYGSEYPTRPRLGQGAFRVLVTEAYNRRCAATGERTLPALEASHIKPYSKSGPHAVENGLLLRADLHNLFDRGYITVTRDLHIEVSRRVKEDYDNGQEYYTLHGEPLRVLPQQTIDRPSEEFIEWHNQHVYAD